MMSQIVQATYGHANLQFDRSAMGSLRVVSNFVVSDRGAGENTHTCAKFQGDAMRRQGSAKN